MTTGNTADNGIAITTGSAATSITASGAGDTITVAAAALANNTALTLAGSAAEVVSGLVGNVTASWLTGALTVTTGEQPTTASRSPPARRRPRSPTISAPNGHGHRRGACRQYGVDLSGSAGVTVTGLEGNITASAVTGALNVTSGAVDNGMSIATGAARPRSRRARSRQDKPSP